MAILINSISPESYKAQLLDYKVGPVGYSDGYMLPSGRLIPVKLKAQIGLRDIQLTFDFNGTAAETAQAIGRMTMALQAGAHIELPDGFLYWCVYTGASTPTRQAPWIEQVTFSLSGVRHTQKRSLMFTEPGSLSAEGDFDTPATVVLTPSAGATAMMFNGIIINSDKTVTIDGLYTTILDDSGNNIFGLTNMTEWPSLSPGANEINFTGAESVMISYYPLYA